MVEDRAPVPHRRGPVVAVLGRPGARKVGVANSSANTLSVLAERQANVTDVRSVRTFGSPRGRHLFDKIAFVAGIVAGRLDDRSEPDRQHLWHLLVRQTMTASLATGTRWSTSPRAAQGTEGGR